MDRMNDTLAKIAKQRMAASTRGHAKTEPPTRRPASAPRPSAAQPPRSEAPRPPVTPRRPAAAPQAPSKPAPARRTAARGTAASSPAPAPVPQSQQPAPQQPAPQPPRIGSASSPQSPRQPTSTRVTRPLVPDVAAQIEPPVSRDALDMDRILEMPGRGTHMVRESRRPYAPDALPIEAISARTGTGPSLRFSQGDGTRDERGARDGGAPRRSWSGMSSIGDSLADLMTDLTERRKRRSRMSGDGSNGGESGAVAKPKPAPVCPLCGGAGYLRRDVPVGDPTFGQPVPCKCKERELAERERMEEERRIAELDRFFSLEPFRDKTFETFHSNVPGVEEAYSAALSFAQDPAHSPYHWLVLVGETGVGKTHLAASIAQYRLAAQDSVFFAVVPDLLDHLRSAFAPSAEVPYGEMFDTIREVGTLILDDLGSENNTGWATEKLFQIINHRYNHRMPTVVTTNQQMFERMDARIASRLSDPSLSRVVTISARSHRPRAARTPPPNRTPPRW